MNLKKILKECLSAEELRLLVRGFDLIGDIAVIIIPRELEQREKLIAEAVFQSNKRIKVVVKRAGIYGGEYRTIPLKVIGGEERLETIHQENGVRLCVNLEEVYYSPRSANERMRVAGLVTPGEHIMVFFSGIAPFPLMISKHSDAEKVFGVEKNPVAHLFGMKNLKLNRRLKNIFLYQGDVTEVLPQVGDLYNRICMPFPKNAEPFLVPALKALKRGGWLHFYDFQTKGNYDDAYAKVQKASKTSGRECVCKGIVECGHTAPRVQRICVDAQIL